MTDKLPPFSTNKKHSCKYCRYRQWTTSYHGGLWYHVECCLFNKDIIVSVKKLDEPTQYRTWDKCAHFENSYECKYCKHYGRKIVYDTIGGEKVVKFDEKCCKLFSITGPYYNRRHEYCKKWKPKKAEEK